MKESDLYPPLKIFLEAQGYEVKGEVGACDIVAVRNKEEPIIIELKLTLNLDVILQAVDRLNMSSTTYIGIPKLKRASHKKRLRVLKLLRMIGVGLILIDPSRKRNGVEITIDPTPYKPRKSAYKRKQLLGEFHSRIGDPNLGGSSTKKGRTTAYRQKAIRIAIFLEKNGKTKASILSKETDEPKARAILYRNVYGWFDRLGNGIYQLTDKGRKELVSWN
jgi:hypothetical protein